MCAKIDFSVLERGPARVQTSSQMTDDMFCGTGNPDTPKKVWISYSTVILMLNACKSLVNHNVSELVVRRGQAGS